MCIVIIVWIINKENNMNFDIIRKIEGEKMLKKENLEFLLSRAMQSNADFAEITTKNANILREGFSLRYTVFSVGF